jgi:septum formation protein
LSAPSLLLASASPRRRQLLELAGIPFEALVTDAPELSEGDPERVVVANALRKAEAGREVRPAAGLVLGADTEVVLDGITLGKAADEAEARERLERLAGRTHTVLGGLALLGAGQPRTRVVASRVTFAPADDRMLRLYLASGEWRDRAGAYAVQGLGSALIERVDGDLANVIGLSVRAVLELLAEAGAGPADTA